MEENKESGLTPAEEKEAQSIAVKAQEPAPEPQADSFVTLDYVKEIYLNTQEQIKLDKKKIRLMRLCVVCLLLVVVVLAAAVISAGPYVKAIVNDINQLTAKVMAIDINAITTELTTLMKNANEAILNANTALTSVSDAAGNIAKIDMDSLNGAIGELTKAVENFSKLDISKLNSAIENFYNAAEKLSKWKLFG